jgi:hypothetical protein
MSKATSVLLASVLALSMSGCGADDETSAQTCAYSVCTITDASCVQEVARVVGCKRGESTVAPTVRFLTAKELLAEREAGSVPLTDEELQERQDILDAQALVGLMPAGIQLSNMTADPDFNFSALYRVQTKDVVVLTDQGSDDDYKAYLLLVHEMVHAYQDARWDLAAQQQTHATTFDRGLGHRALIEGEAEWYTTLADLQFAGLSVDEVDWSEHFGSWQADVLERAAASEWPLRDVRSLFTYAHGSKLVFDAWQQSSSAAIDELYAQPPDSVRQVMAGYAAWPDQFQNEDAAFNPQAAPVLSNGYELLDGGHLGVWLLNAMVQRTASGGPWLADLSNVSADYYVALRQPTTGEVAIVWRVRSGDMAALSATLQQSGSDWSIDDSPATPTSHLIKEHDGDLVLIASSDDQAWAVWAAIAGWQSPEAAFPAQ